jgi:hypothetical protein
MKYDRKMNRYERRDFQKEKLGRDLAGEGRYLFQNNSDAGLMLPKPDLKGRRDVGPRMTFEGDNYFMQMVRTNLLRLIKEIEPPQPKGSEIMLKETTTTTVTTETLLLDQPPTITQHGQVEHIVQPAQPPVIRNPNSPLLPGHPAPQPGAPTAAPTRPVNEKVLDPKQQFLLTEDPLDGVDFLI